MKRMLQSILLAGAYLASPLCSAGIIDFHQYENDARGIVYVEDTGLEWLRLSYSKGMSYNDSIAKYQKDGFYAASIVDVNGLLKAMGVKAPPVGTRNCPLLLDQAHCTYQEIGGFKKLYDNFGITKQNQWQTELRAMYSADFTAVQKGFVPYLTSYIEPGLGGSQLSAAQGQREGDSISKYFATFLVRTNAPIPVPAPLTLFLSWMLFAAVVIKGKKS